MNEALISRNASVNLLREIILRSVPLDQVEEKHLGDLPLRERKLARAITITTLRHIGEISYVIDHFMKHPFDNDSLEKNIMRVGLAQLLYLQSIPEHAAIHGTVELAKERGKQRATGIINAILRRAQREATALLPEDTKHLFNIPKWLQERIVKDYGKEDGSLILKAMLNNAKLDLRVRNADDVSEDMIDPLLYNIPLHKECYRLKDKSTHPTDLHGWDEGHIYVQDAMSQVPARFITGLTDGHKILDMCAAPGGKTLQLLDYNKGAHVTACDISETRAEKLKENLERCNLTADVKIVDGTEKNFDDATFDAILLDAPCSATGTTRRNPDVLVIRRKADVKALVEIQKTMLNNAANMLKVGGKMVYSTCSLLKAEGENQVAEFLEAHPNFEIQKADESLVSDASLITPEGYIRSVPSKNLDGFFAVCLVKKA